MPISLRTGYGGRGPVQGPAKAQEEEVERMSALPAVYQCPCPFPLALSLTAYKVNMGNSPISFHHCQPGPLIVGMYYQQLKTSLPDLFSTVDQAEYFSGEQGRLGEIYDQMTDPAHMYSIAIQR